MEYLVRIYICTHSIGAPPFSRHLPPVFPLDSFSSSSSTIFLFLLFWHPRGRMASGRYRREGRKKNIPLLLSKLYLEALGRKAQCQSQGRWVSVFLYSFSPPLKFFFRVRPGGLHGRLVSVTHARPPPSHLSASICVLYEGSPTVAH